MKNTQTKPTQQPLRSALTWQFAMFQLFVVTLLLLTARAGLAEEYGKAPYGLMTDLLEKTDVVWRDGLPTQLQLDELGSAIERLQIAEIRSSRPYFSWIVPNDKKNARQTAMRIQVATTRDAFDRDEQTTLLWDSGKRSEASSTAVPFGAQEPLAPASIYFWRVKIWDQDDRESDWSELKAFKTASELQEYATSRYPIVKKIDRPIQTLAINDSTTFLDFERASFGQIKLEIVAPETGGAALVRLGERVKDGRVDRKPAGTTRFWEYRLRLLPGRQTYAVKTRVDKRNSTGAAFLMPDYIGEVMPFRYAEVEFCDPNSKCQLVAAERETATYPFDETASRFHCNRDDLNRVWELCKYSIAATSFAGVYLDGDRERIPYEGDALLNQLSHYSVDREYSLARFSQEYMIFHPTWPTEWNLQSVQMAWYDYLYTGDARNIAKYYDDLKAKSLVALAEENGLISTRKGKLTPEVLDSIHFKGSGFRDIVDWPHKGLAGNENADSGETDGFVFNDFNAVVNAYHYFALNSMANFAQTLGKDADVKFFTDQKAKLNDSYQTVFFDQVRGVYRDGEATEHAALHSNMFPLAFGLVPADHAASVTKFIQSRGMRCSVYGAQFFLEAIYQGENDSYGLERMTADDLRGWINMMRVGSTITLEAWDDRYKPNQDWNHAWGAAPANIIPRKLVGIEPTSPGCATLRIKPQIASLTEVDAKIPTIRGPVKTRVVQNAQRFALDVEIPGNVDAEVYIPAVADNDRLLVDGEPVSDLEIVVKRAGKFWVLPHVGAGRWQIERVTP